MQRSVARLQRFEQLRDFFIAGDIALKCLRARQAEDHVPGFLRQPLVLIGDRELPARRVQLLRNGPGDAALVGNAEHDGRARCILFRHESPFPPEIAVQILLKAFSISRTE